jgi:hypothetical protein
MGQKVWQRGAPPANLLVGRMRKPLQWGLLLVFILGFLCSAVFLPQKADAKTVVDTRSGRNHTVTLYDDGTVEATGSNNNGQCNVNGTSDVAAIAAGNDFSVVLYNNGVVSGSGCGFYWTDWVRQDYSVLCAGY